MFFVPKALARETMPTEQMLGMPPEHLAANPIELESPVGRCRRHAPSMSGWPVMFTADWCGDHKLDENKI
jgi:hypothetical protein